MIHSSFVEKRHSFQALPFLRSSAFNMALHVDFLPVFFDDQTFMVRLQQLF